MNLSRKLRSLVPLTAVALLAIALLAPAANAANQMPTFVSTVQYKALVNYVEKLHTLANTPATDAQKATYEGQLENKHRAAVNKSTALFNRAKRAAQAESQRAVRSGILTIRRTEAGEMAALRREYDARMDQAAANYGAAVGKVEDVFAKRVASLHKQIRRLRQLKAKSNDLVVRVQTEEAIERRTKRIVEDRKLEQEEIADLRAGYSREKTAIRSAKATATRVTQQNDEQAIQTLRVRAQRILNTRVRTLQSTRTNQLSNLEMKLNAGKAAIARMPQSP